MFPGFEHLQQEAADALGLDLSEAQVQAMSRHAEALLRANAHTNLTAITDSEEVRRKHFLDSLSCLLAMQGTAIERVIDVGSGAGFPGLPIKVALPKIHLTLVDSVAKKTNFMHSVVQDLGLQNVEVVTARGETIGQDAQHREKYDWAIARAVAALPVLMEYLLPLVKVGGYALAQKGESAAQELEAAQKAIKLLGGEAKKLLPVRLPGINEDRYLVVIHKVRPTPSTYPRREGIPTKKPLG
jgi:16S rRNA (guanine527-N7)-methyltransferase